MRARRHYLEQMLQTAINEKDFDTAKTLIQRIQAKVGPSLFSLDENGESFLFQAIEAGAGDIAEYLLPLLKEDKTIIFAMTQGSKKTLVHLAVEKGYENMVTQLIDAADQFESTIKIGLQANSQGMTPLHYAALYGRYQTAVELLLKKITEVDKKSNQEDKSTIHVADIKGNTALHYACSGLHSSSKVIAMLIENGARLDLKDNSSMTPFKLICSFSREKQIELFHSLSKKKQYDLLQCYRSQLIHDPHSEIKTIYFTLAGLYDLKTLLIAHHEFNPKVPVRNSYQHVADVSSDEERKAKIYKIEKKEYDIERDIDSNVLNSMPLYREKLAKAYGEDEIRINNNAETIAVSDEDFLSQDRGTLHDLICSIENYLGDLQNRPITSSFNRALAIIYPIVVTLLYVGVEAWLGISLDANERCTDDYDSPDYDPDCEESSTYYAYLYSVIMFGGVGGAIALFSAVFLPKWLWDKEANIPASEWKELLGSLQKNILEKLQMLEKQKEELPISKGTFDNLTKEVNLLEEKKQSITKAIGIFTRLKDIIETIQKELNLRNQSISHPFFERKTQPNNEKKSDVIIDIHDSDSDDDENKGLLDRRYRSA